MRFKFLIIPSVFLFQTVAAQNNSSTSAASGETGPAPVSERTSTVVIPAVSAQPVDAPPVTSPESERTAIVDYKSVYETETAEEEVKMAAERFKLTQAQQEIWLVAAEDRRRAEKQALEKLESNTNTYSKDGVYRGLRTAQNTFYETLTGYLTPTQKQDFERDRQILNEKQRKLAKLAPPPTVTDSVNVAPADSAAIGNADKKGVSPEDKEDDQ